MASWEIIQLVSFACIALMVIGTLFMFSVRSRKFKAIAAERDFAYSKEGTSDIHELGERFEVFARRQAVLATAVHVITGEIEGFEFAYFEITDANYEFEMKTSLLICWSEADPLPDLWLGMGRDREDHERSATASGTIAMRAIDRLREDITKCSIECQSGKLLLFRFGHLIKPEEFDVYLRHGFETWQFLFENTRQIQL